MKIISNFSDYYDNALQYGVDEAIVFKRLTTELKFYQKGMYDILRVDRVDIREEKILIRPEYIGFCGKLHKLITFEHTINSGKLVRVSCYDEESCLKYLNKLNNTEDSKKKNKTIEHNTPIHNFFNNITRYFMSSGEPDNYNALNKTLHTVFTEHNVPYFVLTTISAYKRYESEEDYRLFLIPNLKMYDFIKVMNPVQAYQEIAMYVGGVLIQETNPMIEISNKDMAIKKGFGHKYAFRKEPKEKTDGKRKK